MMVKTLYQNRARHIAARNCELSSSKINDSIPSINCENQRLQSENDGHLRFPHRPEITAAAWPLAQRRHAHGRPAQNATAKSKTRSSSARR